MIDVRRNNRLLPLHPEELGLISEAMVELRYRHEPAPVFEELSDHFWLDHFSDRTRADLAENARMLGIDVKPSTSKPKLVAILVGYFREATGAGTTAAPVA